MEDSYTVHRRRKAAARKREKTPEAPRRGQDDVIAASGDDEEDARARMERMVQETERLEELEEMARQKAERADPNIAEKPQRALKRAMSPEVRRKDEEDFDPEAPVVQVLTLGVSPSSEKSSKESKDAQARAKKASAVGAEVKIDRTKEISVDVARKSKREEIEGASLSGESSHPEKVKKDSPPETVVSMKKGASPEVEKREKNRTDEKRDESTKDAGNSTRGRKSRSQISDKENEDDATTLDKNRHEAAVTVGATRESRTAKTGSGSDNVTKNDEGRVNEEDARYPSSRETSEKTLRKTDESVKIRKRDVISPSKVRTSESRVVTTTKRATKERNVERSGYTTDSSDNEENAKRILRRKRSPEGPKSKSSNARKTPSRSRATTDTDGDIEDENGAGKRTGSKRSGGNHRRRSSDTDEDKRESVRRAAKKQANAAEDDHRNAIRKSGTFPVESPRDRTATLSRSPSDVKKQIIPLSDDSLIEDFEKAQQEYLRKERGILDRDPLDDDYINPRMEAALRRRKFSIVQTESEVKEIQEKVIQPAKRSWFGWLPFFGKKAKKNETDEVIHHEEVKEREEPSGSEVAKEKKEKSLQVPKEDTKEKPKKVSILEFFRTLADFFSEFRAFVELHPRETRRIRIMRNRCMAELLLAIIYCGLGAFVFRFTEGAFETFYKCGVKRVKRDFLDSLWNFSHNMREEDWKSMARRKLMEFEEQLHTAHEAGVHSYSGQKSWSFLNAVVYCLTVITTIGYGHISPSTTTGRAITIVYAIFGIPMFLIILADFGKLFTRGIKFLWAFVRRVYYTGSCRRVRRTAPVQEVMKGVQLVYDLATFRRPSQMNPEEIQEMQKQQSQTQTVLNLDGNAPPPGTVPPDTPGTPAMSTFAIDDEFNLPISVAIFILLVYIFVGATVYNFWEEWGFFESFYFVFISMSTIGFGDYVPKHPIYMMLSIVYLVFGLALTSMCINVVQVMLSDSFKQASQKIGATIGFEVAEEDGSEEPAETDAVELADVHTTIKESESKEQVAPKAKQEDVEL